MADVLVAGGVVWVELVELALVLDVEVVAVVEVLVGVLLEVTVGVVVVVVVLAVVAAGLDGQAALAAWATLFAPWLIAVLRVASIPPRLAAEFVSVVAASATWLHW